MNIDQCEAFFGAAAGESGRPDNFAGLRRSCSGPSGRDGPPVSALVRSPPRFCRDVRSTRDLGTLSGIGVAIEFWWPGCER